MILIVDDKPENIFSLKTLLEINKFNVDTALSGEEALKKILKFSYFLIILDVQMPGMDGFEVAEAISGYSKAKDIPIIFLSANNTDKRFITKGYASGGMDYLTKPFDPDLLLLKVKTFYKLYSQSNELQNMQQVLREEIEFRKLAESRLQKANAELEERVAERTKALQQSLAELEARNNELEQFGFITSHDLTEPLRKIQVFSHLVKKKYEDGNSEGAVQFLERIIASSDRLVRLIQDLLTYSRLSAADIRSFVNINQVISDICADLELTITETEAQITVANMPELQVNPSQIRLVLQNLIANALKFSRTGVSPVIVVKGEIVKSLSFDAEPDDTGAYCRMVVADNGIGFDEQYTNRIFTMFQRLNAKEAYEGTGMGLAITKKIVEAHNGIITANSKEGEGAVFTLVLPIWQNGKRPVSADFY